LGDWDIRIWGLGDWGIGKNFPNIQIP